MTRSIAVAALLAAAVAACAQKPAEPPVAAAAPAATVPAATVPAGGGLLPYCGPVWSVERQGYVSMPCSGGTNAGRPQ